MGLLLGAAGSWPLFRPSRPDFIETAAWPFSPGGPCYCSGLLGRTSLRLGRRMCGRRSSGRLFRPSRPDFIETELASNLTEPVSRLFRPSRPDFIETGDGPAIDVQWAGLFRPSRPDFIETSRSSRLGGAVPLDCSGLLGRTSLRLGIRRRDGRRRYNCSGLLGRTSLRRHLERSIHLPLPSIVPAF